MDWLSFEINGAFGRRNVTGYGVEKRGFARPIGSDYGAHLTSMGIESHARERPKSGKIDSNALQLEKWFHGSVSIVPLFKCRRDAP